MIREEDALRIAHNDAMNVYRDLTIYNVKVALDEGFWKVDYELRNQNALGGGPHYVISAETGEIVSKRYEQ